MTSCPAEIAAILGKKREAYDEFLCDTRRLRSALERDEAAEVHEVIERRQELIRTIEGLDRQVRRLQQSVPPDQKTSVVRITATIAQALGETLKEIISANQQCDAVAAGRREKARQDLTVVRRQEDGLQGYAPKRQRIPKFLNVQT